MSTVFHLGVGDQKHVTVKCTRQTQYLTFSMLKETSADNKPWDILHMFSLYEAKYM